MKMTKASGSRSELFDPMKWADAMYADPKHRANIDALMTEMNLAQDLVALRKARDVTQVELAERVGLTQPAIARLESDSVKNVELKTLVKVAAALGARVRIVFEKHDQAAKAAPAKKRAKRTAAA